jgi:prolyl-tRNA editing enzyme YbaK/EbsC (Cys-tRNA(Pro) deacylase)
VTGVPEAGEAGSAVERVRAACAARQLSVEIIEYPSGTRTAEDAARAVGTSVGQIVKSLVFIADGAPILVLASGANRVDPRKLARLAGASRVEKASADVTREATGFAIGGVPPLGHRRPLRVFVDRALLVHPVVYAAAGTPRAVFAAEPDALTRAAAGTVGDLAEEPPAGTAR